MNASGHGRDGNLPVPAVAVLRDVTGAAVDAARRWRDPVAKLRRKKKRARRRATFLGAATGVGGVGTASLIAASADQWMVVATGGTTALFAVPAVAAVRRFRKLDAVTLPPHIGKRRTLPPVSSSARSPMERLSSSEQSLTRLLDVITRSGSVDREDLDEIGGAARAASDALDAAAADLVALEAAARGSTAAGAQLGSTITMSAQRLGSGVDQFEDLVSAAAKLAAAPRGGRAFDAFERNRSELISASDRLEGWALSWKDIDRIEQRYRS